VIRPLLNSIMIVFVVQFVHAQSWTPVGSPGFIQGSPGFPGLVINKAGIPYMVYIDDNYKANVAKHDSDSWINVGNTDFSPYECLIPVIALDTEGIPYVAYENDYMSSNEPVSVMKYNGSYWDTVGPYYITPDETAYVSIAFNNNNTPYVAYDDLGCVAGGWKASVMKYNGTSWVPVGSPCFSAGQEANLITMAIDGIGTPYVVYEDVPKGQLYGPATVMKYDGSNWVTVGNAGFSAGYATFTDIAIDRNGIPYVIYENYINGFSGGKATVMKYDGNSWTAVGGDYISDGVASCTAIAIDSSNVLYAVYRDSLNSYKATAKKYNGTTWETLGNPGFSAGDARYFSIAIDPNGTPYVSYTDEANGGYATVMKYVADTTSIDNLAPSNNFIISPNPSPGIFHISFAEKITAVQVFDVQGRMVMENNSEPINKTSLTIDLTRKAKGVYFLRATAQDGSIFNGKLVVE